MTASSRTVPLYPVPTKPTAGHALLKPMVVWRGCVPEADRVLIFGNERKGNLMAYAGQRIRVLPKIAMATLGRTRDQIYKLMRCGALETCRVTSTFKCPFVWLDLTWSPQDVMDLWLERLGASPPRKHIVFQRFNAIRDSLSLGKAPMADRHAGLKAGQTDLLIGMRGSAHSHRDEKRNAEKEAEKARHIGPVTSIGHAFPATNHLTSYRMHAAAVFGKA